MNKKILAVILFIFLFVKSEAQDNLMSGYILRDQFDTVFGFIYDYSYSLNSQFCDFKEDQSDSLKRYFPEDIYGYRFINGKYYISKEVKVAGKDSLIFLEFLIHGMVDFYFMQDHARNNHYYATNAESPLLELIYSEEIVKKDGKEYIIVIRQYISVLEFLTRDCPELANDIRDMAPPRHRILINFGETYHNQVCKDWDCIIYNKKMKFRFIIELAGGYKLFSHNFNEYYRSPGNPFIGFKFYMNNPTFSERSYFGTGFFYEGESVIDSSGVTYRNFKIPLTYNYSPPKKGLSPTICAGFNLRNYDDIFFTSVSVSPGLKFNFKTLFINTYIEFEFASKFLIPLQYHSTNFGVSVSYKIE